MDAELSTTDDGRYILILADGQLESGANLKSTIKRLINKAQRRKAMGHPPP